MSVVESAALEKLVDGSSSPVGEDIDALRCELAKANEKLNEWKAKTKVGVDRLREQVSNLTHELETSKATCNQLRQQLASGCAVRDDLQFPTAATNAAFDALHGLLWDVLTAHEEVVVAAVTGVARRSNEEKVTLEKYKRRAEQSLKLSSNQQDTLASEVKELRAALDQMVEEIKARDRSIEQRNLAVAALEKQLDAAMFTVEGLRAEAADRQLALNCDGVSRSQMVPMQEVQAEIERIHKDFGEREELLHHQHREECERLVRTHEADMCALEDEMRNALQTELLRLQQQHDEEKKRSLSSAEDDEAYVSLMNEKNELVAKLRERDAIVQALEKKLAVATPAVTHSNAASGGPASGSGVAAPSRLRELEQQVAALSEQLWAANNALLETKSQKRSDGGGRHGGSQQVSAYLRSIMVKLLCERSDDVRANLIPVLTTLLQLEADDLRLIYTANPGWMK